MSAFELSSVCYVFTACTCAGITCLLLSVSQKAFHNEKPLKGEVGSKRHGVRTSRDGGRCGSWSPW